MKINTSDTRAGLLALACFLFSLPLLASDLSPDAAFYTQFDKVTKTSKIFTLDNRLAVSATQESYVVFSFGSADPQMIKKATLHLFLVHDPLNVQVPKVVSVHSVKEQPLGKAILTEGSLQVGNTFPATLGTAEATTEVNGSQENRYWDWDVTALVKGCPPGSTFIIFAVTRHGQDAEGAPLRFTGKNPSNDSGAASRGQPPALSLEMP